MATKNDEFTAEREAYASVAVAAATAAVAAAAAAAAAVAAATYLATYSATSAATSVTSDPQYVCNSLCFKRKGEQTRKTQDELQWIVAQRLLSALTIPGFS